MALAKIASVRLAPGQAGYYDEVSGIYLTIVDHTAEVYSHMNTTNLKRAVKNGKIYVVTGSLEITAQEPVTATIKEAPIVETEAPQKEEVKQEVIQQEEVQPIVLEAAAEAEVLTQTDEEKVETKKTKKKTSKKQDK